MGVTKCPTQACTIPLSKVTTGYSFTRPSNWRQIQDQLPVVPWPFWWLHWLIHSINYGTSQCNHKIHWRGAEISFFPQPLLKFYSVKRNNTRYLSLLVISQFRSCFSWMSIVLIPTVNNLTKDQHDFFQRESYQRVFNESRNFTWIT